MFNLEIYKYTSFIITRSMLLPYTHLRNMAFNTITAVDGKKHTLYINMLLSTPNFISTLNTEIF